MNWIMYVYKADRRTKTGERFVNKYPLMGTNMDQAAAEREIRELTAQLYPAAQGWRIEARPATKIVKNLITGADVEIDADTPRCCDPSSETYWTM